MFKWLYGFSRYVNDRSSYLFWNADIQNGVCSFCSKPESPTSSVCLREHVKNAHINWQAMDGGKSRCSGQLKSFLSFSYLRKDWSSVLEVPSAPMDFRMSIKGMTVAFFLYGCIQLLHNFIKTLFTWKGRQKISNFLCSSFVSYTGISKLSLPD